MRLLLVAAIVAGCAFDAPPNPPVDPSGCEPACVHLRELDCPEGHLTPEEVSCERVCRDVQASQLNAIDTECIIRAPSCAEAGEC